MKKQSLAIPIIVATATTALLILFWVMGTIRSGISITVLAAPRLSGTNSLKVSAVHPNTAPNDVDIDITITGDGFTAELTDTTVITLPAAYLEDIALAEVSFVSSSTLSATLPWGLLPGVYTLTVVNPDGGSGSLAEAFTVTEGIGVWTTGGPYGGNIFQVIVNPFTPTIVYAVADFVGLFASYDSAETWKPILEGKTYNFSIAIDAADPNEIFAGGGGYVYHTQDGGDTWEELVGRSSELHHCYVHRLVTHPSVSGSLYDAVSLCQGHIPLVDRSGIYFSDDHGTTWISLTASVTDTNFTALAIQPQDPTTILAGTERGNLFTSQDGGQSWNWTARLDGKIQRLDFNPYVPSEAWVSARSMISNPPPELYKSTNLIDWIPVTVDANLTWGQQGWDLTFQSDMIWATSIGVYTSVDGGDSWNPVGGWHDSALSLDASPDDPTQMYVGTFRNGLYRSSDRGLSWRTANDGLAGLNPNSIAVDPNDPDMVYANAEIWLLKSDNGGYTWRKFDLFTGGYPAMNQLATDPFTPDKVYFGQYGEPDVQGLIYSCYSNDGGEKWEIVTVTLPTTMTTWSGGMYVITRHPAIPGRIYGGATVAPQNTDNDQGLIYASDDYGENWTLLGPSTPISEVLQIAIDAVNPDLVYAATRGSGLWKSMDGGESWAATPFTRTAVVPYVTAHPTQENKIYFASSTIDGGVNYISEDAGETWVRVDSEIEYREPFLFTPTQPALLYAACEFSEKLCRSNDEGSTWEVVPGITYPGALAAGSDGERVVIYVGIPVVSSEQSARMSTANGIKSTSADANMIGGGVYRLTMILHTDWVYLPLVAK
jgi:photosystem II stability/assembly factor-like uncharacterized protein